MSEKSPPRTILQMQEVQEKKTRGKAKAGQEPDSDAPAEAES